MIKMKTTMTQPQAWWSRLSDGERGLIWSVMKLLRGAKRSEVEEVARAAAKWESGIGCFIKLRLMSARRTGHPLRGEKRSQGRVTITVTPAPGNTSTSLRPPSPQRGEGVMPRVTSCPSTARSPQCAVPAPR